MRIKIKTIYLFLLCVIIFLSQNCFHLWKTGDGAIEATDICFVLCFFVLIYILIRYFRCERGMRYKWEMLLAACMVFSSAVQSFRLYGQPFVKTILSQRMFLIYILMYFVVSICIKKIILNTESIKKMIFYFGFSCLVLYVIQFLLREKVLFLDAGVGVRYGRIRFYFQSLLLCIFYFMQLNKFLNGKRRFFPVVCMFGVLFDIVFIQQYRLSFVGILLATSIGVVYCRYNRQRKGIYLLTGFCACVVILNFDFIQEAIVSLLSGSETMEIRMVGRQLYMERILENPFLGGGYIDFNWTRSLEMSGYTQGIYLSDNGILAFIFMYGFPGLIWFLFVWGKTFYYSFKVLKRKNNVFYITLIIYLTATIYNECHWYWQNGFILFVLFLCLLQAEYNDLKSKSLLYGCNIMKNNKG